MRSDVAKNAETKVVHPTMGHAPVHAGTGARLDWQSVDRALRTIKRHRAGLDAEEARWLREAEALQIWRPLGMVSVLDYLERVLGYPPRAGQERLRVARALGTLPELTAALSNGALAYSAVRELSRIVTPATEAEWLSRATGKNLREIEDMVSGRRPGDLPDDPPDPDVRTRVVRLKLSGEGFALFRQAHSALNHEHGRHLDDDELIHALCGAALEAGCPEDSTGDARFQIALTVCSRCRQGWQDGAGARVPVPADAVDRAMCDARHIGSIDGDAPERATQEVPPSVKRFVKQRDGGRCRVPGCRSSRGLEIHHIVHRTDGGNHDPRNLAILCSACHQAHHRGLLAISGTADQLEVRRPGCATARPVDLIGERGECVELVPRSSATVSISPGASSKLAAATQRVVSKRAPEAQLSAANARLAGVSADGSEVSSRYSASLSSTTSVESKHLSEVRRPEVTPAVPDRQRGKPMTLVQREDCRRALVGLGWKAQIARVATTAAIEAIGQAAPLDRLIAEALRRCPQPLA